MAILMTKGRLKSLLLSLGSFTDEASVRSAWGTAWSEFFEVASVDSSSAIPNYVNDEITTIKIGVNNLLGASNQAGTSVVVTSQVTGLYQTLISQYDSANFVRTVDLLGQSSASTVLTDYVVIQLGTNIEISAFSAAQAKLETALQGISGSNAAATKLQAGLIAWWGELQANPSAYFVGASSITPPSVLSSLAVELQAVFDQNNDDIEAAGTITSELALDRIAQALATGNTGGILEMPGPLQYEIG